MDQSAKFWDKIAERYSKQPISDQAAYDEKLRVTREYFRPDMEVLEFGCGTGSTAIAHAPYVKHIHAIDISTKMIEIAKGKADVDEVTNITFERSTIDELRVSDQTLDAVLALNVLHLLDNWEEAIAKVHKMLKPCGIFVTNTGCLGDTMTYMRLILPIGRLLGRMPMVKVFTRRALEDGFTNCGCQIDYQSPPGKRPAVFIIAKKTE